MSSYKNKIINCVGHTPRQTLLYFPHYTNTSSVLYANDSDEDDDDEDAPPSTTLSTTLPKLLYVSENDKGNDDQQVVLKLVQSKAEYVVDVGKTSTLCLRDGKCPPRMPCGHFLTCVCPQKNAKRKSRKTKMTPTRCI